MANETGIAEGTSILPLNVEGLRYRAGGQDLLRDITVRIGRPGRSVILGPNGAGKSLFLRLIHGLLKPSAGRIDWNGQSPAVAARRQALVLQSPVLLRRTVSANIAYALALKGVPHRKRRAQIDAALRLAELDKVAGRPARVLSGGEQQRLALARAWAQRPEVLLLDEPTSSLDPSATRAVEAMLDDIHVAGAKVILTTHDLGQARRLADEVVFLHRGQLMEQAPAVDFFERPGSPEARAFLEGRLLW